MVSRTLAGGLALKGDWALGEDNWKTEHDLNLLKLSIIVGKRVLSRLSATPGAPAEGDTHIFKADHPTQANKIAAYDKGAWVYLDPVPGYEIYSIADLATYRYTTAGGWAAMGAGTLAVEDEGVEEGTGIARLNFTGAGCSVSVTGDEATVDVPGGGSAIETLIQRQSVAGVSTVSFTGIPNTYDEILIVVHLIGAGFTGVRVNNDSGANYQCQISGYANGTINLQSLTQTQMVIGAGVGGFGQHRWKGGILGYANTVSSKIMTLIGSAGWGTTGGLAGSGGLSTPHLSGLWGPAVPAAINRLDFNFAANQTSGFVSLYGRSY